MPSESISSTASKSCALERAIRPGAAHQVEQLVFAELLAGAGGHHLLRQNVERVARNLQAVELAAADGAHQRGAFHQLVARGGEERGPWAARPPMPGAADALQRHRDGARRADLAHQVDRADIDAQFERGGGHHRAQFAVLEAPLGLQAQGARQAAVVRQHGIFAQPLGQVMRHALGQAARVDEDQGGAVLADQLGHAVVDLAPHFVAGHGAQFVARAPRPPVP